MINSQINQVQNLIITGVTGLVGQHLLYELLKRHIEGEATYNIVLLVRGADSNRARERIIKLLSHAEIPDYLKPYSLAEKLDPIQIVPWHLGDSTLLLKTLEPDRMYVLLHLASSLDLSRNEIIYTHLRKINFEGTLTVVKQLSPILKKVVFVGTAYTQTDQQEPVASSSIPGDRTYRNPYERVKAETEIALQAYCTTAELDVQIIRLGTICGRLLDTPLYYTSKFDVFYGFCRFFYRAVHAQRLKPFRLFGHPEASLNITSCDYAAKAMVAVLESSLNDINVVQTKNLENFIPRLLTQVGFNSYEIVLEAPTKFNNNLEKTYYRVFEKALSVYTFYRYHFDASNLRALIPHIPEPDVDGHFAAIIDYANQRNYTTIL